MRDLHKELLQDGFISQSNHDLIEAIQQRKVLSVYYELRFVLYIGIMLFTGGIGYLVYENMGEFGHFAVMFLILVAIGVGNWFIVLKSQPYSNGQVKIEVIYFDYLLVLVSLLIISLFTYVQVYFDLVDVLLKWSSLASAILFLFMAYRYDSKMVLSLGIVALAAVFGLTLSPIDWATGSWLEGADLYVLSLIFGASLLLVGQVLKSKGIKPHFTFTIHNFGWMLFYFGALAFIFDHPNNPLYALLLILIGLLVSWYTWRHRSFLFFIYSCVATYIAITYFPFTFIDADYLIVLAIWYFPVTLIGGVLLLIKNKKHFSDDE